MPDTTRSAKVHANGPGTWTNRHENVVQPYVQLYDVYNTPDYTNDRLGDLRLTVSAIQKLIADAIGSRTQLRALGGGWSLSTAATTGGGIINTKPMNWYFQLGAASLDPRYAGNRQQLDTLVLYSNPADVDIARGLVDTLGVGQIQSVDANQYPGAAITIVIGEDSPLYPQAASTATKAAAGT